METAGRAGTGTRGSLNLGPSEGQLDTAFVSWFILPLGRVPSKHPGESYSVKRDGHGIGRGNLVAHPSAVLSPLGGQCSMLLIDLKLLVQNS